MNKILSVMLRIVGFRYLFLISTLFCHSTITTTTIIMIIIGKLFPEIKTDTPPGHETKVSGYEQRMKICSNSDITELERATKKAINTKTLPEVSVISF